jgi:hypothetical protein
MDVCQDPPSLEAAGGNPGLRRLSILSAALSGCLLGSETQIVANQFELVVRQLREWRPCH